MGKDSVSILSVSATASRIPYAHNSFCRLICDFHFMPLQLGGIRQGNPNSSLLVQGEHMEGVTKTIVKLVDIVHFLVRDQRETLEAILST